MPTTAMITSASAAAAVNVGFRLRGHALPVQLREMQGRNLHAEGKGIAFTGLQFHRLQIRHHGRVKSVLDGDLRSAGKLKRADDGPGTDTISAGHRRDQISGRHRPPALGQERLGEELVADQGSTCVAMGVAAGLAVIARENFSISDVGAGLPSGSNG